MEELKKNEKNELTPQTELTSAATKNTRKKFLITIGVALILMAVIWIWKSGEITNVKKEAEIEKQILKEQAIKQIVQTNEEHLKLLAKPFVWAVRTEMMQGNINQVNLYANDMVKEKNFQRIAIANDKGIIISSTNKKDNDKLFSTIGNDANLTSNNTSVENVSDTLLIMTSPIMGFNSRLGTLQIKYLVKSPDFR